MGEQRLKERVWLLLVEVGERRGIGRVPVLIFLVFGMPSCSNSTSCSCLGEPRFTWVPIAA